MLLSEVDSREAATVIDGELRALDVPRIMDRIVAELGDKAVIASSLGLEDVVLLDLASKAKAATGSGAKLRVAMLDTGRLHEETYALFDRLEARYRLGIELFFPETVAVEALVRKQGPNGFYTSLEARHACCDVRKVAPLARMLKGAQAWVTGIRASQSATRSDAHVAEWDGRLKLSPLVGWSLDDVWQYVRDNDVPYNPLHDQGYPSIGCAPCTRAIEPGEDIRAGRWWWENPNNKECGLHTPRANALRALPRSE